MSAQTPNLGLYIRGPVSTENAANGGVPSQWDFDLNMAIIDAAVGGGGGGTSVQVNGAKVNTPNFNGTTPAAPAGNTNIVWQVSGSSVSGYAPTPPVTSVAGKVGVVTLALGDITAGAIANGSTATTQAASDNSTKVATTAYADAAVGVEAAARATADALLVPKATTVNGHALSANVTVAFADIAAGAIANGSTATTQAANDNSTKLATTAYANAAVGVEATARAAADALLVPKTTTVNGHALSANVSVALSDLAAPTANTVLAMGQFSTLLNYDLSADINLTSVATSGLGDIAVYTGTITGGAANGLAGAAVRIKGFPSAQNNGLKYVISSTATTLSIINNLSVAESGTATAKVYGNVTLKTETAATAILHSDSPVLTFHGYAWNTPGVSDPDTWSVQNEITGTGNAVFGNLTFNHVGDQGTAGAVVFSAQESFPNFAIKKESGEASLEISGAVGSQIIVASTTNPIIFAALPVEAGAGLQLTLIDKVRSTTVSFAGVEIGDPSAPVTFAPASGSTDGIAFGVYGLCQQDPSCTGNYTGMVVQAFGHDSGFSGPTFLVADFQSDFGHPFQVGETGAIISGTLTDSSGSTGSSGQLLSSTGSGAAWVTRTINGHPLTGNVVISASDITTGTLPHAQLPALLLSDLPAGMTQAEIDVDTIKLSHTSQDVILTRDSKAHLAITGSSAQIGSSSQTQLATPATPTVTPTLGSASTWGYKIVARDSLGVSIASTEGTTTTGASTLDGTHFNTITWTAVTGAVSYDVYRTTTATSPTTKGLLGNTANLTFTDNAVVGDGTNAPTVNTTGNDGAVGASGGSTAGCGAWFQGGYGANFASQAGANSALVFTNKVGFSLFYIPFTITIRKVSGRVNAVSASASQFASFGLYDINQNKVIDSGTFNVSSGQSTGVKTNTISAVTIQPGFYYFAWTTNSTDATWLIFAASNTFQTLQNGVVVRTGSGATTSAGALTATLGTLAGTSNAALPAVIFES